MIIDSHQHFWDPSRGDYSWLERGSSLDRTFGPDDLRPLLDDCKVDGTLLVQAAPTSAETDYLLNIAADIDWIVGVVGWVDLASPTAEDDVKSRAASPKLVGVRPMLQDISQPDWILRPDVQQGLAAVTTCGLVFDALIRPHQIDVCETLAMRFPTLSIVLDHAAKPRLGQGCDLAEWRTSMARLADRSNVVCKISGLCTELVDGSGNEAIEACIHWLLSVFGRDRLMWGSDWPVVETSRPYRQWFDEAWRCVREGDRSAIFGGTASRIYGLRANTHEVA